MIVRLLVGLACALVVSWLLLALIAVVVRPRGGSGRVLIAMLPDVIRLLRRLAADPATARGVRWRLLVAVVYNVQPINLIPDFIPVIGFVDNVVVIGWALRSAIHSAGSEAVARHWPGTPQELAVLYRVARLGTAPAEADRDARRRAS
jgi:uncharacterized membrane protein YkvA (DUF1232 family)